MKNKHGLSGIYYRQKNIETERAESVVFEDLEPEEQDRILNDPSHDIEFYKRMIKLLADTLYQIGEEFDVFSTVEKPEEE